MFALCTSCQVVRSRAGQLQGSQPTPAVERLVVPPTHFTDMHTGFTEIWAACFEGACKTYSHEKLKDVKLRVVFVAAAVIMMIGISNTTTTTTTPLLTIWIFM